MRPERALAGVAALGTAVWVVLSFVSARHGVDLTDESFYLASYRWWSESTLAFSGAQYVVGPLFQAFGYDVPLLRVAKVVVLVALHLDLALCLLGWIGRLRGERVAGPTRAWVVACLVATAAAPSIWLPRSPGYNDLTLIGGLVVGSAILSLAARDREQRLPAVRLVLTGAVLLALLLAKWSTAVMILCFVVWVATWAVRNRGIRGLLATGALVAVGSVVAAALVQLATPWPTILDGLSEVNSAVAATSNSPVALLALYLRSTAYLVVVALAACAVLGLPLLVLRRWPRAASAYAWGVVPVLAVLLPFVLLGRPLQGGPDSFFAFAVAWTAWSLTFLAGLHAELRSPQVRSALPVLGWLAAVPWLFGVGTGNELYFLTFSLLAPWVAALVAVLLLARPDHPELSAGRAGSLVVAVLLVLACGISGTSVVPYRTDGTLETTEPVTVDGTLEGLLVTPEEAEQYADLAELVGPPDGRRLLALDELAGLALLLDLQPLGEVWASRIDPARTAAGVESVCRGASLPAPVVISDRDLVASDIAALASCGARIEDYEQVPFRLGTRELTVYLPPDLP